MVEKCDGINLGIGRVHVQSDEKRKVVTIVLMS